MGFPGTGTIWMNGTLVPWKDATIHIASHVIHYGTGVFEGARCYATPRGSACFRLDAHMRRLQHSATIYRMAYPLDLDGWIAAVLETIRANGLKACYIRPLLYRGYETLGVTMYQMLTGVLPYDTPGPADLDRLMRGELRVAPRLKNPKVPKAISDIVVKAMAPDIASRYQRARDLLDDLLAAYGKPGRLPRSGPGRERTPTAADQLHEIHSRLKAREAPHARFCWHCRKPLHARANRCPFCGEAQ